jgi:hypothetical protein
MFHIAELYQTHVVGRKIASRHTGDTRAGGQDWDAYAVVELDRAVSASV